MSTDGEQLSASAALDAVVADAASAPVPQHVPLADLGLGSTGVLDVLTGVDALHPGAVDWCTARLDTLSIGELRRMVRAREVLGTHDMVITVVL